METKKEKIVSAVATLGILLMLFGATYAYFASRVDAGKITDVEITANTVDVFSFETGDPITLSLDQESFAEGTGNKTGSTFAKATLLANNKTNTATEHYYVYLNISSNTFSYSLGSDKPEILLQVTDASGATVTSLDGLIYSTVTNGAGESVSGFDITAKTGLITLANNKEITANTDTKEETWNIRVVFVNYNENQSDNAGNNFKAKLMIQEEEIVLTMADVCSSNQTLASCVQSMYGVDGTLYYHDSNLENGAGDNSYRYAGSSDSVNNYVCFGSDATTCPDDNLYRIIGVFGDQVKLIKWDYATSALLGTDGDYKSSCSANRSYCFGTNKGTNSTADIGAYYWNYANYLATYSATNYYNVWSYSKLNTVNLNTNFLNNIGKEWSSKIAETTWKVGGNTYANILTSNAQTAYTNEITNPDTTIESEYKAKVALMYVSDYYYGANPTYWTYPGYSSSSGASYDYRVASGENWMYMGLAEWTVVRRSDTTDYAFIVYSNGQVYSGFYVNGFLHAWGIRPVFYLASDVTYVSGSGTKESPLIID